MATLRRRRRALVAFFAILAVSVLADRVALYSWAWQVLRMHRVIHRNFTDPNVPVGLEFMKPPWIFLNSDLDQRFLDLVLIGACIRPDRITLEHGGTLSLVYLPPSIAWTTLFFPFGRDGGRSFYAYTLTMYIGRERSEVKLYQSNGSQGGAPIPPSVWWPRFF